MSRGTTPLLADALARAGNDVPSAQAANLDLTEALPVHQNGSLVSIAATLLTTRTIGHSQVLELQEGRRVFTATLATTGPIFKSNNRSPANSPTIAGIDMLGLPAAVQKKSPSPNS